MTSQGQRLKDTDVEEVDGKVLAIMQEVRANFVITFGPTGASKFDDRIFMHKAVWVRSIVSVRRRIMSPGCTTWPSAKRLGSTSK
jgi:hypothetical protein